MQHILDFETLGQNVFTCPALAVSFLNFDARRFTSVMEPYYFRDLINEVRTIKFSVEDQVKNYGYKIEKDTLKWWSNKEAEARKILVPSPSDYSLKDGIEEYLDYTDTTKIEYWWSRSNSFDPVILQRYANDTGFPHVMANTLRFYLVRDIRTYIDTKFNFTVKNAFVPFPDEAKWKSVFVPHLAVHDVAADLMRMQTIVRAENDLDQIND